jgi:hypothetical protein
VNVRGRKSWQKERKMRLQAGGDGAGGVVSNLGQSLAEKLSASLPSVRPTTAHEARTYRRAEPIFSLTAFGLRSYWNGQPLCSMAGQKTLPTNARYLPKAVSRTLPLANSAAF